METRTCLFCSLWYSPVPSTVSGTIGSKEQITSMYMNDTRISQGLAVSFKTKAKDSCWQEAKVLWQTDLSGWKDLVIG